MEARNRAAGNGDEECGEEETDLGLESGEHGKLKLNLADRAENADCGHCEHGVKQERAQVVAGLQQYPDG